MNKNKTIILICCRCGEPVEKIESDIRRRIAWGQKDFAHQSCNAKYQNSRFNNKGSTKRANIPVIPIRKIRLNQV